METFLVTVSASFSAMPVNEACPVFFFRHYFLFLFLLFLLVYYVLRESPAVGVYIYYIAHNRAVRPCNVKHSMQLG